MLLNPSHKVTLSGLPPDLLDTYVRYKKGTRAILKWLSQHAPAETRRAYLSANKLPINDLAKLAQVAAKYISCMPDIIHFYFRETIEARSSLSNHFRRQTCGTLIDPSTVNHEHFTASLTHIYANLCEHCGEPKADSGRPLATKLQTKPPLSNHFTHLTIEDCSCSDEEHQSISPVSCQSCITGNSTTSCASSSLDLQLAGDTLSDAIETIAIVQQINEIFLAVQGLWRQVGAGAISLTITSAITNVAEASLRELEAQLRDMDPLLICHLYIKPVEFLKDCPPSKFETVLAQGIMHLITIKQTPDAVIRNGTPVYAEIGYLITHPEDSSNQLRSTLSLHLLSTSYKAYMAGLSNLSMLSRCRLSALKVSQQAQSSVSTVLSDEICFPCRCPETLSFHLDQFRHVLQKFTAHKCWDIFFQAPWVAGNHILEILDMCFYYGMKLMRYRHYVGSVLHSYNVLRQLAALEEVPLLEHFCNKFTSLFFPAGQRPTNRFAASWARFVGARIKFRKGHKSRNHRESWCMAIPSHAARRVAGFGIEGDGKPELAEDTGLNEVIDLKRNDYHVSDAKWDLICGREDLCTSKGHHKTSTSSSTSTSSKSNPPHSTHLQSLASHLSKGTKSLLPPSTLNLFAVFGSCLEIVTTLSNATHPDQNMRCICFATTILAGGDRIRDAEALGRIDCWKKKDGERGLVQDASRVIGEVVGRVPVGGGRGIWRGED